MNNLSQIQFSRPFPNAFINRFKTIFWDDWLSITLCCFIRLAIGASMNVFEKKQARCRTEIVFGINDGKENTGQTQFSGMFGAGMTINDNLLADENFFISLNHVQYWKEI